MKREAIILAGGMGTRLASVVADRPKPMAEVIGKPFLEHVLVYLEGQKVDRVLLAVGYKSELIKDHFGNRFKSLEIVYSEERQPLGTGGAILNALRLTESERVFILNGDTYFPVSLSRLELAMNEKNPDLVMALRKVEDASRYGTVRLDERQNIREFEEKKSTSGPGLINGGIYLLNTGSLVSAGFPDKFSFEEDFLKKYAGILSFHGIEFDEFFVDIGIPETYLSIRNVFL